MNEIEFNGKKYVLKSSSGKTIKFPVKNKKGLTYCIVRTYSAGVFAGWINKGFKGKEAVVYEARRLWYWKGANSLSELAMKGVSKPSECKFPLAVPEVILKEIVEVLPCSKIAQVNIIGVKEWSQ